MCKECGIQTNQSLGASYSSYMTYSSGSWWWKELDIVIEKIYSNIYGILSKEIEESLNDASTVNNCNLSLQNKSGAIHVLMCIST